MKIREILTFSLGLVLLLVVQGVSAKGGDIGVVYPDLREPYRSIFTNIIDGIRDTAGNDVNTLPIKKTDKPDKVSEWVKSNNIKSIIALGSRSQKLISRFDISNKIVGAITKPPKDNGFDAGVLLTPDPERMFSEMNRLVPGIKNIYIVYSEANSGWYLDIAEQQADLFGINLIRIQSVSKKDSLNHYKTILDDEMKPDSAIWLLQDSFSSDSRLILPLVLEAAWDKKIPVISNKAGHVERGALLALYPDHFELGISLAEMLVENKTKEQKYAPFSESFNAANTRTADHLELDWSRKVKRSIKLVFPKR